MSGLFLFGVLGDYVDLPHTPKAMATRTRKDLRTQLSQRQPGGVSSSSSPLQQLDIVPRTLKLRICVTISPERLEQLDRSAGELGRSRSYMVSEAVDSLLYGLRQHRKIERRTLGASR